MHKSAMQQMQQQIPRAGLVPTGGIGTDSKPHQCQQCMKCFSSNHQLVQHIRVHTGEKPYKCSYCDRRFKQLSHVQQHTRLHTGERPYKCHLPDCGRAFIQLSNLQQHLRNHDAQVERAKNRPFHCNICGKGFATESSLRTHTSKELQLHLGVLQQHAALIGGPNATSCPICHKLFLGTDALMEHITHVHKEKGSTPNNNLCASVSSNLNSARSSSCLHSSGTSSSNDPYSAKRRTANHPCPVCGKHYVNEGSLRKHLACHAESSQLTNTLRMWPCSVCQAVFTYENGLLTHMEHMRMDPKHQFAAQYVLSRAAAERRDRDNILAATLATSSGSSGAGLITLLGESTGEVDAGGSSSLCPSPSGNSECSSNGPLSSVASDTGSATNILRSSNNTSNINNNNTGNNNISHLNNNCNSSNSNMSLSSRLNDILRTGSNVSHPLCEPVQSQGHPHNPNQNHSNALVSHSYSSMPGVDTDLQNRMNLMAAASAAAAAVAASANNSNVTNLSSPRSFGVEGTNAASGNQAVQAAVVSLAAAMRLNHSTAHNSTTAVGTASNSTTDTNMQQCKNTAQSKSNGSQNQLVAKLVSPVHHPGTQDVPSTTVINVMRDSLICPTMMKTSLQEPGHHQQQLQQHTVGHGNYGPRSNVCLTHQTNHHHTPHHHQQQVAQHLQQNLIANGSGNPGGSTFQHLQQQQNHTAGNQLQTTASMSPSHLPQTALHMQQQAKAFLRSQSDAAFRLAASVVEQQQGNEIHSTNNNNNNNNYNNNNNNNIIDKHEQTLQQQATNNTGDDNLHPELQQNNEDISEVIHLQENRLEQALRLHNDAKNFNFVDTTAISQHQHQQHQQQFNNAPNDAKINTSNTTLSPQRT